jgi:nucleotidyltransferase substrate binding protein (TIGR01987 family)
MRILDADQRDVMRAGVIQNFEFTYELCWKFIKRRLESDLGAVYVDGVSRKELFRLAAEHRLIASAQDWFLVHASRNETVHTYDPTTAEEVYAAAKGFLVAAKELLAELKRRNDRS